MNLASFFLAPDRRLRAGWRALLFLPVFVLLLITCFSLSVSAVGVERLVNERELGLMANGFSLCLSAGLAAWLLFRWTDKRSFRTLGLWFYDGWNRELGWGLLGGLALLSGVAGLLFLAGQVQFAARPLDPAGVLTALGWNLLLLLPSAAGEELLFRGYPFQRLVEAWGAFPAVFLLAAVFGLLHLGNPGGPTALSTANTVLMGVLLALAYLKTRGLWLPIGLHFAWNFSMGFIYSLPVSGIVLSRRLFEVETGERVWLSGGNYGPEGGVLTTAAALAATLWLARTRRLRVSPGLERELQ